MNVSTRVRDGVTVIDLEGRITIGRGDVALRGAVEAAVDRGARTVLLNLERLKSMDSSVMAELGAAYRRMEDLGGRVALTQPPTNVGEILRMTQIITVFDVYETEDEGVEALRQGS
jgi:anti-sigma B factor antagonist